METIGLIAGNGTFPLLFARAARERGFRVAAVAHRGETLSGIDDEADAVTWVRVGQLGRTIRALRAAGVERAVMAGGIDKVRSLFSLRPDWTGIKVLRRSRGRGDDAVLRSVADELARNGIGIVSSTLFLEHIVAGAGWIAGPRPQDAALADVRVGCGVLRALGGVDVGQGVVVEHGVVLAVEAVEGTDAAIRRAGVLGRGGAVVVKVAKHGQDMRFDVPAVGPTTIETMAASGARTLAIEAGAAILLEGDRMAVLADQHGISVVGCTLDGEVPDVRR
jgi:DUF1009 family protein